MYCRALCDAVCKQILEHHITGNYIKSCPILPLSCYILSDFDQVLAEALGIGRAYTEYRGRVPANTYKKLKVYRHAES